MLTNIIIFQFWSNKILNLHENYRGFKIESTFNPPPLYRQTLAGGHSFVIDIYLPLYIFAMDQARPTRMLLDWKPMETRPVGKLRQRWQEDVMEYLRKLKVKNWKETAKDRRTWRDLAEKAKTHKGL